MNKYDHKSLYENLEKHAKSLETTAEDVIKNIVEGFYVQALNDVRIARFFAHANLDNLKSHQATFIKKLFSGVYAGGYSAEDLWKIHEELIVNKGLSVIHFDYFIEDFLHSVKQQNLNADLVTEIREHLIPFREIFNKAATQFTMGREERLFFALDENADGNIHETDLRKALKAAGLSEDDERLRTLFEKLDANKNKNLKLLDFCRVISESGLLVERAFQGSLAVPDFEDFSNHMDSIYETVQANTGGAASSVYSSFSCG